jgi:CheY-like chemotaxis protein
MKRVRVHLIHWNAEEIGERVARIHEAGYDATSAWEISPAALRLLRESPPAAVVIDLSRIPSHGREAALAIRQTKPMRSLPIVFVGGDPGKVARIRLLLPDAVYTTWGRIAPAIRRALASRVDASSVRGTSPARTPFDAYKGTPVPQKLGIKAGATVALIGAPPRFADGLQGLPNDVVFRNRVSRACDMAIWFVRSRSELERGISSRAAAIPKGGLWIAWPKRGSGIEADITQVEVRWAGLNAGLVDYKICAIDATWTGLKFASTVAMPLKPAAHTRVSGKSIRRANAPQGPGDRGRATRKGRT